MKGALLFTGGLAAGVGAAATGTYMVENELAKDSYADVGQGNSGSNPDQRNESPNQSSDCSKKEVTFTKSNDDMIAPITTSTCNDAVLVLNLKSKGDYIPLDVNAEVIIPLDVNYEITKSEDGKTEVCKQSPNGGLILNVNSRVTIKPDGDLVKYETSNGMYRFYTADGSGNKDFIPSGTVLYKNLETGRVSTDERRVR